MKKRAWIPVVACGCGLLMAAALPAPCGQIINVPAKGVPTIQAAMITARAGDTVLVANGVYKEKVAVKAGVLLKAQSLFGAAIDGGSRGVVVTLGGDAGVCGLEIRNGTIGVLSRSIGNSIVKCRISGNRETGLSCAGRLPKIQDNLIVFNRGSGIQGWDVIASNDVIDHNTIAYNSNNGIALGGASSVIIENNIIAFNERFGIKADESVKMAAANNDFFQNGSLQYGASDKNFSLDPKFSDARKKMNFSLEQDSPLLPVEIKAGEIGARLAY
jgi:parallel beta-helix repeat protein